MGGRVKISKLKAAISALFLVFWCLATTVTMIFARTFQLPLAISFPLVFHAIVCKLFSLQCEIVGAPSTDQPTLYVANHVSYLDVFVLGSMLRGAFVAKSEVASWPIFGSLAKLQSTLFLERKAQQVGRQVKIMRNHMDHGESLIMFPEGTSTDGSYVAPFRSSLFAAAENITVQAVTVAYVNYEGEPMTQAERDRYAWYLPNPKQQPTTPNCPLAQHFFTGMGMGRCTVKVHFHEPVRMIPGERKKCALHCESLVRQGLEQFLDSESVDLDTAQFSSAT